MKIELLRVHSVIRLRIIRRPSANTLFHAIGWSSPGRSIPPRRCDRQHDGRRVNKQNYEGDQPADDVLGVGPDRRRQEPRRPRLRNHPCTFRLEPRPIALQLDKAISGLLAGLGCTPAALLLRLGRPDRRLRLAGRRQLRDRVRDLAVLGLDAGATGRACSAMRASRIPILSPTDVDAATVPARWLSISLANVPPAFTVSSPARSKPPATCQLAAVPGQAELVAVLGGSTRPPVEK